MKNRPPGPCTPPPPEDEVASVAMGKKSKKRSSDTRGPSREEDPLVALQELQSHVNSLSLAEAMRAVKVIS